MRGLPQVADAIGGVAGEAHLIGSDGKAIAFGGAPNLGFSVDPDHPAFSALSLVDGTWPKANEVVIDKSTAGKEHLEVGQPIGVEAEGPVRRFRISGFVKFGGVASLGGATLSGFDLRTAQRLFDKPGKLDQIRASARARGQPGRSSRLRSERILPPGTQVRTGDGAGERGRRGRDDVHLASCRSSCWRSARSRCSSAPS